MCSSLDVRNQISPPHKMKGTTNFKDKMKHSEQNGSKYCLNLWIPTPKDHGPSNILSGFDISSTRLTTK
jgi:hypothetical protein